MTYHCSGYALILSISSAPESSWVLFDSIGKLDISSLVFLSKVDFLCFWKNGAVSNFRVGIELPKIEVRFEHLDICAEVHVGSRALPTLPNFLLTLAEVCLAWQSTMDIIIPSIKFSQ
jgi:hypothetical protein